MRRPSVGGAAETGVSYRLSCWGTGRLDFGTRLCGTAQGCGKADEGICKLCQVLYQCFDWAGGPG